MTPTQVRRPWRATLRTAFAALAVLSMFITRAEARDRREHDTDHDL